MTTPNRRDLRRLAMQVLYQLDVTSPRHNPGHAPTVLPSVDDLAEALDEEHDSLATRKFAAELALQAWAERETADEKATALAPKTTAISSRTHGKTLGFPFAATTIEVGSTARGAADTSAHASPRSRLLATPTTSSFRT